MDVIVAVIPAHSSTIRRSTNFLVGQFLLDAFVKRHGIVIPGEAHLAHHLLEFRLHLLHDVCILRPGDQIVAFLRVELDVVQFGEMAVGAAVAVWAAAVLPGFGPHAAHIRGVGEQSEVVQKAFLK